MSYSSIVFPILLQNWVILHCISPWKLLWLSILLFKINFGSRIIFQLLTRNKLVIISLLYSAANLNLLIFRLLQEKGAIFEAYCSSLHCLETEENVNFRIKLLSYFVPETVAIPGRWIRWYLFEKTSWYIFQIAIFRTRWKKYHKLLIIMLSLRIIST